MRWLALAAVIVGSGIGLGGCLGVDSPDGALQCSDVPQRACPEGFYCLVGDGRNTCWRYGHFPKDMAEPGFTFPGGDEDMSVPVGDDLSTAPDDLAPNDDLLDTD